MKSVCTTVKEEKLWSFCDDWKQINFSSYRKMTLIHIYLHYLVNNSVSYWMLCLSQQSFNVFQLEFQS